MTDDHIELCPFCKSEAEIQYPGDMFVTCKGCKAMGPMANSDKSAIAVWNRRASPAPAIPAEPIEKNTPIDELVTSYQQDGFDFEDADRVKAAALRYAESMPDSHARALLFVLASAPAISESEDVRDAARYRWLRSQQWNESVFAVVRDPKRSVKLGVDCPSGQRLDEEIDSSIATQTRECMRAAIDAARKGEKS